MSSSRLSLGALVLALACALGLAVSGLGHRWEWWGYQQGFAMLRWTTYASLVAAAAGLIGLVMSLVSRSWVGVIVAVAALAISGGLLWVPASMRDLARRVPPIHDITTDTDNPPKFVAVLARRREGSNSTDYGGAPIASQQRAAYPDLAPLDLGSPPDRVFAAAVAAARNLGWEIVAEAPAEGRLEATDTTRWWGFKDDVVVRVARSERGSRVDVRSVSRVGRSDLGVNARRIRAFLQTLRAQASS